MTGTLGNSNITIVDQFGHFQGKEGLSLYLVSGRTFGADDDAVDLVWAKDDKEAKQKFIETSLFFPNSDEEECPSEEDDDNVIIVSCRLLARLETQQLILQEYFR